MKLEELSNKHQEELDAFYAQRQEHHIELWRAEMDIVKDVNQEQDRIPESLQQKLDYDWRQFETQWGVDSPQFKKLLEKHQRELVQHRNNTIAAFKENGSEITKQPTPDGRLEEKDREWAELQHDHKAIADLYKAHGLPIPQATQNRMKRHIEDYKEKYGLPFERDESLYPRTQKERELYLNVHDIYQADFAIAQTYEIPPDSTNDRLRMDLHDFFMNYEAYYDTKHQNSIVGRLTEKYQQWKERKQSQAAEKPSKENRLQEFRQRMQHSSDNLRDIEIE